MRSAVFLAVPVMAALHAVPAQDTVRVGEPRNMFGAFTDVSSVAELLDGRVVVVDRRDATVSWLDFVDGRLGVVGRTGDGPGEYRLPWSVFAVAGDTVALFDQGNRRLLLVDARGKVAGTKAFASIGDRSSKVPTSAEGPRAIDHGGRLYWLGPRFTRGTANALADSAPVLRRDPAAFSTDTVAWVRRPAAMVAGARDVRDALLLSQYAYLEEDVWSVLPDGRVAVLRARERRLDLFQEARRVAWHPLAFAPMRLLPFHQEEWREEQLREVRVAYSITNGTLGRPRLLPPTREVPEPRGWPTHLPAFAARGVFAGEQGTLWIERPRVRRSDGARYVVLDTTGRVLAHVWLPMGSKIVALGRQSAYAVARDADDVLRLWRLPMPVAAIP